MRWLAMALVLASACKPSPVNATPEGAVRDFVERLELFDGSNDQARELFNLLSERAKSNLQARSERYGAASGKEIAPWAMLVPSRSRARFVAHVYQSQIVGRYALVDVLGASPGQRAQVPCVLEQDLWRVDLVLPQLTPLPRRPGAR